MRRTGESYGVAVLLVLLVLMLIKVNWRSGEDTNVEPVVLKTVPVKLKIAPDERTLFKFDHSHIKNCRVMYEHDKDRNTQISKVRESMEMLNKEASKYGQTIVGNVGWKTLQALFFLTVANASFINTICETGFNAGHSSYLWLTGNTKAQVYTFTLGSEKYNKPMYEFLNNLFPGRLHAIWGDSKKTIPAFMEKNPKLKCDLIYVDGGHDYPEFSADMRNIRAHANEDYNVVIADDYWIPGIKKSWMEELGKGHLKEHFHCSTAHGKEEFSMAVGRYIFSTHSTHHP